MEKEFDSFLSKVKTVLQKKESNIVVPIDPINYPIHKGQAFYLFNFKNRAVELQKGIYELLGFSEEEFAKADSLDHIHPDDQHNVTQIIKASLNFAIENDVSFDSSLWLAYRLKKKNGEYIKVLRQTSPYKMCEKGKMISNYTVISDISFFNLNNSVSWQFEAPKLEQEKFKQYIKLTYQDFFTKRELSILELLKKGLTSLEIAGALFISKHTVDTHRRNMLQKVNCENTIDLLNFYSKNVI
jgi:DNA-binding CsgD family transcriptional regulator